MPFVGSRHQQSNWVDVDEMPPAGKASMAGTAAQTLPGGDLTNMQNTLSALMIQKQNVSILAVMLLS